MKLPTAEPTKKAWQRPTLQTYGTIGAMTSATDMTGALDGGVGMMMTRT